MVPFKETSQLVINVHTSLLLHADTMHTIFFTTTAGHFLIYSTAHVVYSTGGVLYRLCIIQVVYYTGGVLYRWCIIQLVYYTGGV